MQLSERIYKIAVLLEVTRKKICKEKFLMQSISVKIDAKYSSFQGNECGICIYIDRVWSGSGNLYIEAYAYIYIYTAPP